MMGFSSWSAAGAIAKDRDRWRRLIGPTPQTWGWMEISQVSQIKLNKMIECINENLFDFKLNCSFSVRNHWVFVFLSFYLVEVGIIETFSPPSNNNFDDFINDLLFPAALHETLHPEYYSFMLIHYKREKRVISLFSQLFSIRDGT